MDKAVRTRAVHGILAAVAMVVLFPTGAMLVRVLPGRVALWMHALTQITALGVFAGAVGFGLQLVQEVRGKFGLDLVSDIHRGCLDLPAVRWEQIADGSRCVSPTPAATPSSASSFWHAWWRSRSWA
jgi:hypothetical protein